MIPAGFQQIAAATLDTGGSLTVPNTAQQPPSYVLLSPDTQAVRFRDDGTAPTAAIGIVIAVGTIFKYEGDLKAIRFISATAGANLNISYYY